MKLAPSADNLLLGSGALYFDILENGARTGEIHFGNVTAFGITTTDDVRTKNESMTKARGLYKAVTVGREITLNIVGDEFSVANLALNAMGAQSEVAQTTGNVADAALAVSAKGGRYYATNHRNISAVVVEAGATTLVEGVDYTVDAVSGRVYVVPGGAGVDEDLTVSYSYAASTLIKIAGGTQNNVEAFIRFVADPAAGPAYEVQVYKVQLTPNGELGFITDDFGQWTLTGRVLRDDTRPASPYYDAYLLN